MMNGQFRTPGLIRTRTISAVGKDTVKKVDALQKRRENTISIGKENITKLTASTQKRQQGQSHPQMDVFRAPKKPLLKPVVEATMPRPQKPVVDLKAWEEKTKTAMVEFCRSNGLDAGKLLGLHKDQSKSSQVAQKGGLAGASNPTALLPIFKALDILMSNKNYPPANVMTQLEMLRDSFIIKQSANYWHLYAKAAVAAGDNKLGVELLETGTRHNAQPVMETVRAYAAICRQLLNALDKKGEKPETTNDLADPVEVRQPIEDQPLEDHTNHSTSETADKPQENFTEEVATEELDMAQIEDRTQQEIIAVEQNTDAIGTIEEEKDEDLIAPEIKDEEAVAQALQLENGAMDAMPPAEVASGMEDNAVVVTEDTNLDQQPIEDTSNNMVAQELPLQPVMENETMNITSEMAAALPPKTPNRRRGGKKASLDEGVVFESSTTEVVALKNKSAKKKGAAENTPGQAFASVRRSTRKTRGSTETESDKWTSYRNNAAITDTPAKNLCDSKFSDCNDDESF